MTVDGNQMDVARRRELARKVLAGYVSGPAAATEATVLALAKTEGVVILPVGGVHGVTRYLMKFGPEGAGVRLAGLCDVTEEDIVRRGLAAANVGSPRSRADLERLGFHVCVQDLEEELIRAVGVALVEELFDAQGDLGSFRRMQRQPAWRGKEEEAQMRRFLGAGSQRKLRYARLLVDVVDLGRMPLPLDAVLAGV
jgi:hypothetical protein